MDSAPRANRKGFHWGRRVMTADLVCLPPNAKWQTPWVQVPAEPKELFSPGDGADDELEVLRRLRDQGTLGPRNEPNDPTESDPDQLARLGNRRT